MRAPATFVSNMSEGWLPTVSYENNRANGTCTIEPLRATNGSTPSISNRTSPSMTTHQARVSGCNARGVFVPGREETYSLRRCSSSTMTTRQSVLPLCLALRSVSFVCGLCGGTYLDWPFGAHSCCLSAEKTAKKKTAPTVVVSRTDVFRMGGILTPGLIVYNPHGSMWLMPV